MASSIRLDTTTGKSATAVTCNDLWFSYEVAQNISSTAKLDVDVAEYGKALHTPRTSDGGLSVDQPRRQHATSWANHEIVYKLQLKGINMELPTGCRCMLVGANGAGKTTLMSVIGGKHLCKESAVRVLGRSAFEDTTLSADLALLTGNWTHTVAFAGHNVPYQAMEVSQLIRSNSAGVDPARVERLVTLLGVERSWNLTTVSDGQRRRVQILCKLMKPFKILLLDEITTDLDLLARQDLLNFLREESEERGVSIVYCTHIFDGLDGWASHIAYIAKGEMMFALPVEALADRIVTPAAQRARGWGTLFCAVQRWLLEARPDFAALLTEPPTGAAFTPPADAAGKPPAVKVTNLTWRYKPGQPAQLDNLSFEVPRGARCLLVGANGAGKTTLLRLLGGKSMVPVDSVQCLGYNAFHDIELNTMISMLSGDWTRQVACVGNGVPFQADFSIGYMAEEFAKALIRDGHYTETLVRARLHRLVTLLDMDLEWRLHQVSDGQRRRAQLLLKLLRPSQLLLMDEVTTDLDVVSRQALLQFLREECDERGATVIYSTHILDGLDDWPSHVLHLINGKAVYNGPLATAPGAAQGLGPNASASGSGSLFGLVKGWLLAEREGERLAAKDMHVPCETTPPTPMIIDAPAVPPTPPPPAADANKAPVRAPGKFDRFGSGSSSQRMY
jgi:CCR4-NOT complex subunit CAF16